MQELIRGILPPLTTPFDEEEEIDEKALRAEVRYLIEVAQVHGLVVGGSTGEGHTLTPEEVRQITAITLEEVQGRVPVITGIITNSTKSAIERGKAVADLGVTALQVTPVHYLFRPDDQAMRDHFMAITENTGLPLIIYNVVPWAYLSPQLLTEIVTEVEGVIGVKQSAGDLKLLADLLLMLGDQGVILSAVDALLYPSFVLGAHGAVAAILTAVPTLGVELWEAVHQGNHCRALELHQHLLRLWNALQGDNLPARVKYAMELQGRRGGKVRAPMSKVNRAQAEAIRKALQIVGLLS